MKKYIKKYGLVALTALLFVAVLVSNKVFFRSQALKIDGQKVSGYIHNCQDDIQATADDIAASLKDRPMPTLVNSPGFRKQTARLAGREISVFIYHNDSLAYWSSNTESVSKTFGGSIFRQAFGKLNNGYFLSAYSTAGNYKVGVLYQLYQSFQIQNKHLRKRFHKEFDLPEHERYRVIPFSLSYSIDINGKDGNYLFSIAPVETRKYLKQSDSLGLWLFYLFALSLSILLYIETRRKPLRGLAGFLLLIAGRAAMLRFEFPAFLYYRSFFQQTPFYNSSWIPSMGDLLLDSLLGFFLVLSLIFLLRKLRGPAGQLRSAGRIFAITGAYGLIILAALGFNTLLTETVYHSSISFQVFDLLAINTHTVLAHALLGLALAAFLLVTGQVARIAARIIPLRQFLVIGILLAVLAAFLLKLMHNPTDWLFIGGIIGISLAWVALNYYNRQSETWALLGIIILLSIHLSAYYTQAFIEKQDHAQKVLAQKLENSRDNLAENLLAKALQPLRNDTTIMHYLFSAEPGSQNQTDAIMHHIKSNHLLGYLEKFQLEVYVCGEAPQYEESNRITNCDGFFHDKFIEGGQPLAGGKIFFTEDNRQQINYFSPLLYKKNGQQAKLYLHLRLNSRIIISDGGYPRLLIDEQEGSREKENYFSYAKYKNHQLAKALGNFRYDLKDTRFQTDKEGFSRIQDGTHSHLISQPGQHTRIVVSRPAVRIMDYLTAFSYIFLFFLISAGVMLSLIFSRHVKERVQLNFRNRLKIAMSSVLIASFLFIGVVTVYFNKQQFEQQNEEIIAEKIQSVSTQLENKFYKTEALSTHWQSERFLDLTSLLDKYQEIFRIDMNIYDTSGYLLASSRPEVFSNSLVSRRLHPEALYQLKRRHKSEFIHQEQIGELNYAAAYIPFENNAGKLLGYLHLPYFTQPEILKKEITNLLVAIINIYLLVLWLTGAIAVLIADRVMRPLAALEQEFSRAYLGKEKMPILHDRKDEIGSLARTYNDMMQKLNSSSQRRAESEREFVWREMARRVAHEVRNPLTPMQLSLQHLQKVWEENPAKFPQLFQQTNRVLIDRIQALDRMAGEFSDIGKMPKPKIEVIDIVERLRSTILLYDSTEKVSKIGLRDPKINPIHVLADKDQVTRSFINIIKNSIQSVPEERDAVIMLHVERNGKFGRISITDNGSGIPEDMQDKLFKPKFTTKSDGMGLGLAMVKSIIEASNGNIWFETQQDKGTTFFIELPLANIE